MAESVIQNLNEKSVEVTANFLVSDISTASAIMARRSGNILIVTGYINSNVAVTANTIIAEVSTSIVQEAMASPNSSAGDTARFVIRKNGKIVIEKELKAYVWYSFTLVAPIA